MKPLLSLVLLLAIAWAAPFAGADEKPAAKEPAKTLDHPYATYVDCARMCGECQLACEKCFDHCGMQAANGKAEHAKAMKLSQDCSEFCGMAAKLTGRRSSLSPLAREACAKACDACAAECETFADSSAMKGCAEACKKCAAACREMNKSVSHGQK